MEKPAKFDVPVSKTLEEACNTARNLVRTFTKEDLKNFVALLERGLKL